MLYLQSILCNLIISTDIQLVDDTASSTLSLVLSRWICSKFFACRAARKTWIKYKIIKFYNICKV